MQGGKYEAKLMLEPSMLTHGYATQFQSTSTATIIPGHTSNDTYLIKLRTEKISNVPIRLVLHVQRTRTRFPVVV